MDELPASESIVTNCGLHGHTNKGTPLAEYSPKDKPWDKHRAEADAIEAIYRGHPEFQKNARRIAECAWWLLYGWVDQDDESVFKLRQARFCRLRTCPICQWRRCLMWQARFHKALPSILEKYPKSRWVFLTLTIRNCEITELAENLQNMNKAWQRLIKRKEFKPVQGWLRSTEVTRGSDGSAHPHFHCLLMVPPSWFSIHYVKHQRWVELWQSCMQVGYEPNVDIRAVKNPVGDPEEASRVLTKGVAETLKYATKPSDMMADESWFIEYTRQIHKKRFLATGGALKNVLKVNEESDDDLALKNDETEEGDEDKESPWLAFKYHKPDQIYRRKPGLDVYPE